MIRFDPFDDNGVWVNNGHIMLDPQHLSKGVAYAREHRCTHIGIYDFIRARHHVDLSFLLEMPYVRSSIAAWLIPWTSHRSITFRGCVACTYVGRLRK